MSTSSHLATASARTITSSAATATGSFGCDDTYISSILDTYCTAELSNPAPCTEETPACCTSAFKFTESIYACIASHAGSCPSLSDYKTVLSQGLTECTSYVASATGAGDTVFATGASKSVTAAKTTAGTADASTPSATGVSNGTSTKALTGASTGAQSSATAATTSKNSAEKIDVGLRTTGMLALVGGMAMFFLGGGL